MRKSGGATTFLEPDLEQLLRPSARPARSPRALGPDAAAALLALALLAAAGAPPGRAEGLRGLLAVRGDRVIASESADVAFTPASVQKLVVSAAVLHYLGHDHQIETTVRAYGALRDGVLGGDLVLRAAGDPTWSAVFFRDDPEAPLRALASQIREAGVVRVEGDLVLDTALFPGRRAPGSRSQAEMGLALAAPVAGLAIDENSVEIRIAPGRRVGDRASVSSPRGIEIENDTVTAPGSRDGKGSVELLPRWGRTTIAVRGEYPLTEPPYTLRAALPSPELEVGRRLRDHLARFGVLVEGKVRIADGTGEQPAASRADAPVVARILSPPLSEVLTPVLTDSSNWTAEMLVLQVALARTGSGRYDDGIEALVTFLTDEVGVSEELFALDDVSGLSPDNLMTPSSVVALLRWAWRQPWRGALLDAMAVPGRGTLQLWPAMPPVVAKTGTLSHSLSLAGFLAVDGGAPSAGDTGAAPSDGVAGPAPDAGGEPVIFAVFLNHDLRGRGPQRREIVELLRSWRRLAGGGGSG